MHCDCVPLALKKSTLIETLMLFCVMVRVSKISTWVPLLHVETSPPRYLPARLGARSWKREIGLFTATPFTV